MNTQKFIEIVQRYPDILNLVRPDNPQGIITYGVPDQEYIESMLWIYQEYFSYEIFCYNDITLEELEHLVLPKNGIIVFKNADFIFENLENTNRRRLNTNIKNLLKKNKIHVFSFTNLNLLNLKCFDHFRKIKYSKQIDSIDYSFINIFDEDTESFEYNITELIDLISDFVNQGKVVYINLALEQDKLRYIYSEIERNEINITKKWTPESQVVINSAKYLSNVKTKYDIYIFNLPTLDGFDFLRYFQITTMSNNPEIFIDSHNSKQLLRSIRNICIKEENVPRIDVMDYQDTFESNTELMRHISENFNKDVIVVNIQENYYRFEASDQIRKLNLKNLSKKDYDTIRAFVKFKLLALDDLSIRTCQLAAPCSPKDRSKKLNSISNKVSSYDYRCEVTCEIFKDYTIGVIVWNELLSNRKEINLSDYSKNIFIYQTTNGLWRYSILS